MATVHVRRDVWDLGDEDDPWRDPAIVAYADGVGAMMKLAQTNPSHPANWVNQAAIHKHRGSSVSGRLEDQCQHACFFFFPWHRMYLFRFEQIIRSHLDPAVADDWALPYWNYSDVPERSALPPAFRQPQRPDGTDNPLFTQLRNVSNAVDINAGNPLLPAAVSLVAAMRPDVFTRSVRGAPPGFGGGRTNPLFHHDQEGPGSGPLEVTPHGSVHNQVGGLNGLMTRLRTAALDPIFWLHHANIDRLWEVWLRSNPPHSNPTDGDWLMMPFDFVDEFGTRVSMAVSEVLEIENQLHYTYSGLPSAAPPPPAVPPEREEVRLTSDELPAEMVGASDAPVVLEEAKPAETSFELSAPSGPVARRLDAEAREPASYLNVEVEGEENPGLLYGVYVNLPPGEPAEPESPHYVGALPFFGIETTVPDEAQEEAPHRLRYVFDITPMVAELTAQGRWDPDRLHVTFAPIGAGPDTRLEAAPPPVRVSHVSLFVE
jgi:tyrosinase